MQRMCRRMFAAVVGMLAAASLASAQSPPPNYLPPIPSAPVPAYVASAPIQPASGATIVRGQGGCSSCGNAAPTGGTVSPYGTFGQFGPKDRNGCGSIRSDLGFMFGSCKSFFDPCGPQPSGCFGGGGRHGRSCPPHQFGAPYGVPHSGCAYDSFLNH